MSLRTDRTPQNRRAFLELLAETGNVKQVCTSLEFNRGSIYAWRDEDAAFKADWEAALQLGLAGLEDEARRRAIQGSDLLLIFLLKGGMPDKYRERQTIDVTKTIVHEYRSLSTDELQRRLDALRLEQDQARLQIEGSNVVDLSDHRGE